MTKVLREATNSERVLGIKDEYVLTEERGSFQEVEPRFAKRKRCGRARAFGEWGAFWSACN